MGGEAVGSSGRGMSMSASSRSAARRSDRE
jgi:hypothetical protein